MTGRAPRARRVASGLSRWLMSRGPGVSLVLALLAGVLQTVSFAPVEAWWLQPLSLAGLAVLVWDDGLDYDPDGTPHRDDAPGYWPHSYHQTIRGAEVTQCHLEAAGVAPGRVLIVDGYAVPEWDADRPILA